TIRTMIGRPDTPADGLEGLLGRPDVTIQITGDSETTAVSDGESEAESG
ncbi:MAG: hypothetical protein ACI8TL_001868, partial [Natronomonas sp.]